MMKRLSIVFTTVFLLGTILTAPSILADTNDSGKASIESLRSSDKVTVIVRVPYPDRNTGDKIFISFNGNILGTNYEEGYHLMEATQEDIARLNAAGLQADTNVQADMLEKASAVSKSTSPYACYRTVEETFASAYQIANDYPDLATWIDVGDSWEKSAGLGGYDMMVLVLTNTWISGPKPKLFITSAIHAGEIAPAELSIRFAEHLVNNYGKDADVTWILDHHEIHLMLHSNPDGRKYVEQGIPWRKNTNQNYCGPTSSNRGADLNRNFTFQWGCCDGSSGNECASTYRGPEPSSEPEVQAIQNYMKAIFPDQRGPDLNTPAPDDATGIYIDTHSYSELVLWSWGFQEDPPPNKQQLQTLGRKLAYWNGYSPMQEIGLYPTDGTTTDFGYGELGVATYLFELGTAFAQDCDTFENTILPANLPSLIYAAKVVRTPYITPLGPDTYNLSLSQNTVPADMLVTLEGTIDDTRYQNSNGTEASQTIAAAEYYIDVPVWNSGAQAYAMTASDSSFDAEQEDVRAMIDTSGLSTGQHILFVRGKDTDNNWGAFSAIFLNIEAPTPTPPPSTIPEPSTLLLMFTGLVGILALNRKILHKRS